jgi:alkylhydroperoxidase/carboxymuconolactone decarboxylase family protein YurZ
MYMVKDGGEVGKAYLDSYFAAEQKTALDAKTFQLVYLAYLAADGVVEGIRKHAGDAKKLGVTREEMQSTILAGLPVCGAKLQDAYAAAMAVFDE